MFEFLVEISDTVVLYKYKGFTLRFTIDTINKRLKDEILSDSMFTLLNGYIEKKGDKFASELYNVLLDAENTLLLETAKKELEPMPLHIVHNILDMFDFEEVKTYVRESGLIHIPTMLPEEYDIGIELDEKGSREQTYLKNDYVELITLVTILKSTLGVVGNYASVKSNVLAKNPFREYLLFSFYLSHPIFKTDAFTKVYDSIYKLIDRLFSDRENTAIRIIEKTMSKDNLPVYITAYVVIQKLLVNSELTDTDARNTITKIYHFASNKIKLKDNTSNVKIKHFSNGEDDSGESESVMESYRTPTELSPGSILEFRSVFMHPITLARDLDLKRPPEDIYSMVESFKGLAEPLPIEECIYIISWLYKDVVDSRCFDYLELDEILNALAVGFLYLWDNGHKDIAYIISSFSSSVDDFKVNFSLKNKLKPEIRDELDRLFPNNKAVANIDGVSESSFIEESITIISKNLMGYNLVSILPKEYLLEKNGSRNVVVTEGIKNILAEYIIFIHGGNIEYNK
jgi:hypothetical protein